MIKTSRALLLLATLLAGSAMAQGMQVPKPSAGLMPNPNIGKPLFDTHCASCHGADLEGSDKGPPCCTRSISPPTTPTWPSRWR